MKEIILTRFYRDNRQTLGVLVIPGNDLWVCKTFESLPCVPQHTYLCTYTRSDWLSEIAGKDTYTYEIVNLKGCMAGIRIHPAHCPMHGIALGSALKELNIDTLSQHTGETAKEFNNLMKGDNFWLIVQDDPRANNTNKT